MVKAPLVTPDERFGEAILEKLDAQRSNFPVSAVLWLKDDERWTLVIGTPEYERLGPRHAYRRLIGILSDDGPVAMSSLPVRLEGNDSPLIKDLRKKFAKTASVEGMRLGGHTIGGKWIEDAYVYRIK